MGCKKCGGDDDQYCNNCKPEYTRMQKQSGLFSSTGESITEILENNLMLLTKAIACHCECSGMNAENLVAVHRNEYPSYSFNDYFLVMNKWGLVDTVGKALI